MSTYNTIAVINKKDAEILRLNRRVLEESPDLIAIVSSDYRYFYVNPAYVNVHGLTARDFIGCHVKDFLGDDIF